MWASTDIFLKWHKKLRGQLLSVFLKSALFYPSLPCLSKQNRCQKWNRKNRITYLLSSSFPVVNELQMWCWIWYPAHKNSRLNTRRYFNIIHFHTHSPILCVSYLMYRESEQNQTFNKVGLEKKVSRKPFLVHSSSENKP